VSGDLLLDGGTDFGGNAIGGGGGIGGANTSVRVNQTMRVGVSRCDQSRTAGKQSRTRCAIKAGHAVRSKQDNAFAAHPERSDGCAANACASRRAMLALEKPTSS
jgi:hypothetical protein